MRPEDARLTVTEPGWSEPKWLAKNPSFKVETDSDLGLCRASGLLATDLSKTASIFAFFDQSSQREKKREWFRSFQFLQLYNWKREVKKTL